MDFMDNNERNDSRTGLAVKSSATTNERRQEIPNSVGRAAMVAIAVLLQIIWFYGLAVRLTAYSTYIQIAASILSLVVVMTIYRQRINSAYKISWILFILLFPVFGLCIYLLFGQRRLLRPMKLRFANAETQLSGTLPKDGKALNALRATDRGLGNQAAYLENIVGYPAYNNTDVVFYGDTCEALEAQKLALRGAKHFIFMEYHAIEDSTAWQGIEEILAERAAAGVDVRVFYDDVGSMGFINTRFVKKMEALGIRCRIFNPLIPVATVMMNNRDHRKITVVDGCIGFTGGYNLADEYFGLTHPYGEWKDTGLRLEGEAVRSLTAIFLEMWAATQKEPLDPTPFLPSVQYMSEQHGTVLPYADSPLDDERVGENVYINMIGNAKEYVYLSTPYLIISDEMERALTLAARRGVDVRIVTPGIPDKPLIYRVTRSYYSPLTTHGVHIYEYTPGFIHAKQCVADGQVAAVGTINLDFRSLYLHFENGCWFCGCSAVADVRKDFDALFAVSRDVGEQYGKRRILLQRGIDCLLRLFSPLM